MRRNRLFSWLLAAAVAAAVAVTPAAAAYPDVTAVWSWAAEDIDTLTERGIFAGYEDGTFRPARELTAAQSLTLMARMCAEEAVRAEIGADRRSEVSEVLGGSYAWFWNEAATCLEAEVLTGEELSELYRAGRLDGTVTLEEFAVWLVRAMDLEACALAADETALDFGDAESIDPDKRPYVSLLASQGILAGDQNGNLSPKSPVTRARAAVLVARALRVLDSHGAAGMELPEYTSYGWTSGTLTAVEAGDGGVTLLTLEDPLGGEQLAACPEGTPVYLDHLAVGTSGLTEGLWVRVCYDSAGVPSAVRLSRVAETVTGEITAVAEDCVTLSVSGGERTFTLDRFTAVQVGDELGDRTLFDASASYTRAVCTVDSLGDLVSLRLEGGERRESGLIQAVEAGADGGWQLTVRGLDGITRSFAIPASAAVTVDSLTPGRLDSGCLGGYAVLRISNDSGEAVSVSVDTVTEYIQGVVRGASFQESGNTIAIGDIDSTQSWSYSVADDAAITYCGEPVSFGQVARGWYVTARIQRGRVAELTAVPGPEFTTGTLVSVERSGGAILLRVEEESGAETTFYLNEGSLPPVLQAGEESSLEALEPGDRVAVTVWNHQVALVEAESRSQYVTGRLQRMEQTEEGPALTLLLDDGTTRTYSVEGAWVIYNGGSGNLSDLEAGDHVGLTVVDGVVRGISVAEEGSELSLRGTALYVNTSDQTILLRTSGGTIVTVDVPTSASILEGETQGRLGLRNLRSGDTLRLTGTYQEDLTFLAETVVRE